MTCFFCKGNCYEDKTTQMIELSNCILVVKNVPCRKCSQCGEVTLSSDTSEALDTLSASFEKTMTEVAVINFEQKTA